MNEQDDLYKSIHYHVNTLTDSDCESPKCSHCDGGNDVPCLICE
jgi:hypothetical protein